MKINIKKLHKDAIIPEFAHNTDSGFDLFTVGETTIPPKQKAIVKTGIAMALPQGWGVMVRNKSGITMKGCPVMPVDISYGDAGTMVMKTVAIDKADITVYIGTIDEGYRGEVGVMVKNENDFAITIPKHIKIAQGVLEKIQQCEFEEVEEFDNVTTRGTGGYGSTGVVAKEV